MVAICNSYLCKLCFVFDLNKNLTLKKDNLFSFSSLNRFFALSLDKIGCISTKKIKVFGLLFCFVFDLYYLCSEILIIYMELLWKQQSITFRLMS